MDDADIKGKIKELVINLTKMEKAGNVRSCVLLYLDDENHLNTSFCFQSHDYVLILGVLEIIKDQIKHVGNQMLYQEQQLRQKKDTLQ